MFDLEIWPETCLVLTWLIYCRCAPWRKRSPCVSWCWPSPSSPVSCVTLFYPACRSWLRVWRWTRPLWPTPSSRPSLETLKPTMSSQTGTALSSFHSNKQHFVQIMPLSPSSSSLPLSSLLFNLLNNITEWSGLLYFTELTSQDLRVLKSVK